MHLDVGVLNALVTMVIIGLNWVSDTRASCLSNRLCSEFENQLLTLKLSKRTLSFADVNAFCRVYVQEFINLPQIKSFIHF